MRYFISLCLLSWLSFVQAEEQLLTIGYLSIKNDSRYTTHRLESQYSLQPWGESFKAAEVGVKDAKFPMMSVNVKLALEHYSASDIDDLIKGVNKLHKESAVQFFITELPGDVLLNLSQKLKDQPLVFMNISALDNQLRREQCQANILHVSPSWAMLSDALAQYLISKKWRDVLMLRGKHKSDVDVYDAMARSAKRFGLKIVDTRDFVLGSDPRARLQNNIALLTANADYDVVMVADGDGEFGRYVPYSIQDPRPVVGTGGGLVPDWWHWAWERHGAPQVNQRLQKKLERHANGYDWSAMLSVKIIAEAIFRKQTTDFQTLLDYIHSDEIIIDGTKGFSMGFRPWNNQLRQSIFLTTGNWVVAHAPLDGFMHPVNNLDTLGYDEKDSGCHF